MTALATRPQELRAAARSLVGVAAGLGEAGARIGQTQAETATGWQGTAALGQRLATERIATQIGLRRGPVEMVAGALGTFADQAEHAQTVVRVAQQARDQAVADRVRLIAMLATVTDPGQAEVLRERILRLEVAIRGHEDEISWVERQLEQGRTVLDRVLRDSWVGLGLEELRELVDAGREIAPIYRGGSLLIVGSRVVLTTVRMAKEFSPFARHILEARLDKLLKVVRKPPFLYLALRLPFRVLIPLTVIPDAWQDLWDGGGYTGVRGFTLRLTAAVAIPGSVAMVLPHPLVAGLGAISVGVYYAAKGGWAIWDHRILLGQVGRYVYQRRRKLLVTARRVLAPTPALPLGPLGPISPLLPGARKVLSDLPRLKEIGRLLPGVGGPITVPATPIAPGPRLPVVPSPSVGVVSVGILLPKIRKLF